jgi:chaperonin GroEL
MKKLEFGDHARHKLVAGINKMAAAVGSTLGPSGNTVLIESPEHLHGMTVTKDGVTVAKSIDLIDATENLAVRMMKEAASRTADIAGDGTTTSIILTKALVDAAMSHISGSKNGVLSEMRVECDRIVEGLRDQSRDVTNDRLVDVATISSNNDALIGGIISKVYSDVGRDGIVTVGRSMTSETHYETTQGMRIARGWSSDLFINDHKKDECVFEDVHILVSDGEVSNILQLEGILKPILAENKKLLIIAPCSQNVVNTLGANVAKRGVKICVIPPPNFGYKQHELMSDIALSVNATYFSEKTGDDLSHMTLSDLGHADKVIVGKDSTVVMHEERDSARDDVRNRVDQLRDGHELAQKKEDKEFILERIASLTGGVGVIYAGGNTDLEQKELYDRIDDAVCAVRSALDEGIVAGGGIALYREAIKCSGDFFSEGEGIAKMIFAEALMAPLKTILSNADCSDVYGEMTPDISNGYDVKAGVFGDMFEMGVIDPTKVTRCALQNAVSVAITILSTNAIITMARVDDDEIEQPTPNYTITDIT